MLSFKKLILRNFFSFGNNPQEICFDEIDLALVLGQNNDANASDDTNGRRNGVGKSALIQGIFYGLYGKSIGNQIKIPNLVNKINGKNCEVSIDFEKDGVAYRVERGRSPTFFRYYIIGSENDDETRGESKNTQEDLEKIIGISQTLFEHIVILNTNVNSFLELPAAKQREIIEELVSLTQLTDKANNLKEISKETKKLADQEKFKIDTVKESNYKIQASIEMLEENSLLHKKSQQEQIDKIMEEISIFESIDFDELMNVATLKDEITKEHELYHQLQEKLNDIIIKKEQLDHDNEMVREQISKEIENLEKIDIKEELENHEEINIWNQLKQLLDDNKKEYNYLTLKLNNEQNSLNSYKSLLNAENERLTDIKNQKCPLCQQSIEHDDNHSAMIRTSEIKISELEDKIEQCNKNIIEINNSMSDIEIFEMPPYPKTIYKTLSEAQMHSISLENKKKQLEEERPNPYIKDIEEIKEELSKISLRDIPDSDYSVSDINILKNEFETMKNNLNSLKESRDPYAHQIKILKENSLQEVSYDEYNRLEKLYEHQEFLSKLLLNKDSFVRKRIIEQNISFLNNRLKYYIEKVGSQQNVTFMNDLSVEITLNGREYDFSQLSRGERTRIIIALNLSFRDTYESLYQSINLLMIDELLDNGLDFDGIESVWYILQDLSTLKNKNIFVVSHREELVNKANKILKVTKEDGFSNFEFTDALDM